jgi:hypothetical protein
MKQGLLASIRVVVSALVGLSVLGLLALRFLVPHQRMCPDHRRPFLLDGRTPLSLPLAAYCTAVLADRWSRVFVYLTAAIAFLFCVPSTIHFFSSCEAVAQRETDPDAAGRGRSPGGWRV